MKIGILISTNNPETLEALAKVLNCHPELVEG